jgi:hypothetical protein
MKSLKAYFLSLFFFANFFFPQNALTETSASVQIPMATRWVTLFNELEISLANALHANDEARLDQIVDNSFELRLTSNPDEAIPRDIWLKTNLKNNSHNSDQIGKMAVHELHDTAIVSFESVVQHKARDKKIFVVDVWRQENNQWKLRVRYSNDTKHYQQYLRDNFVPKKY